MHISEGVLSVPVLAGGAVITFAGTAFGLKKLDYDAIMPASMLTAAFFVASLIHVPVGPGSVHLMLNGLLGVLLGWSCFPVILVALFLQAKLFFYGGVFVLGVNTANFAIPAIICGLLARPWLQKSGKKRMLAAFCCGFFSILFSALLMAAALFLSDQSFIKAAQAIVVVHIPVMVVEGCITMFVVSFLAKVQPEYLDKMRK